MVVGNHDVFHTPHRGTRSERAEEFLRTRLGSLQRNLEAFGRWTSELSDAEDRLGSNAAFPLRKKLGDVALYAANSNAPALLDAGNGFWCARADARMREATQEARERRVLAIHHAPKASARVTASDLARLKVPLGFPKRELQRLTRFVDDAAIDAVVSGHLHATRTYSWRLGATRAPVYVVGRTGGMHRTTPVFGVLEVPTRGAVSWEEVPV